MRIQYEAHKVYVYYAFVKYDVIGYIMSPYCDEYTNFSYYIYKIHQHKAYLNKA